MIRIHQDTFVPQYPYGYWKWNPDNKEVEYLPIFEIAQEKEEFIVCGGYKYKRSLNQIEEMIFRQEFCRPEMTYDSEVILLQDIKNLVLFLSPKQFMNEDFIIYLHTEVIDRFLHALIIYFEYYLKMLEFVLVRRDETTGLTPQIQSDESLDMKYSFSCQLSQYRLMLAREYAQILMGEGEMKPYYFITPVVNIAKSRWDRSFHEALLSFATQVVWIAMHRRGFDEIETEMERLFRSDHFRLRPEVAGKFTKVEECVLFGQNFKRVNFRVQGSPIIQEIEHVRKRDVPLLWIGKRKYRGSDARILFVEMEFIVPPSQLFLVDVTHGILGHPKKLYNTLLMLHWPAVRAENYTVSYDPYHIMRQPDLHIPKIGTEELRRFAKKYYSLFNVISVNERVQPDELEKWFNREELIEVFKGEGMIIGIMEMCDNEGNNDSYGPSAEEILRKFDLKREKKRKK